MYSKFISKENVPGFPSILYKYRTWNKSEHKRLLTHCELYYASPDEFNEITECNLDYDYNSVSEEDIYKFCEEKVKIDYKDYCISEKEFKEKVQELYSKNLFHDLNHREKSKRENREILNKSLSIFSASQHSNNARLWSTFTNERRGYCVGIDFTEIYKNDEIFGSCGRVEYYDEKNPPKISPISLSTDERVFKMMKLIYSLPNRFIEEDEFRFTKMYIKEKIVKLNPNWISEVILGSEMNKKDELEILKLVNEKYKSAQIKKLFVDPNSEKHIVLDYKFSH
jgi:hypothetical protein